MSEWATFTLPPERAAAASARRRVSELARGCLDAEELHRLELLVSETVTNGVRHGRAELPLEITLAVDGASLRVEVVDRGRGFDPAEARRRRRIGGWGLELVDRLSSRWGIERIDGTRVWFELPCSGDRLERVAA